jgi:hypothetical protein
MRRTFRDDSSRKSGETLLRTAVMAANTRPLLFMLDVVR